MTNDTEVFEAFSEFEKGLVEGYELALDHIAEFYKADVKACRPISCYQLMKQLREMKSGLQYRRDELKYKLLSDYLGLTITKSPKK